MRRRDIDFTPRAQEPVKLFHRANHIGNMLDHMNRTHFVENRVGEWVGNMVDINNRISSGRSYAIDADTAGVLVDSAADIKDARHFSSVSRA